MDKKINIDLDELVNLYKSGISITSLSTRFNCSRSYIYGQLRSANVYTSKPPKIEISNHQEVIDKYMSGATYSELANFYNVNRSYIYKILKDNNVLNSVNRPTKLKLSNFQIANLIKLYRSGVTVHQLSKEFNISETTIYRIFRNNKIKLFYNKKLASSDMEQIIERYRNGEDVRSLAKEYGCTYQNIYYYFKSHNIERTNNRPIKLTKSVLQQIANYYKNGLTVSKIAKKLNLSTSTIYNGLNKLEIPLEKRKLFRYNQVPLSKCKQIIKEYKSGKSVKNIANDNDCYFTTVYRILQRFNISRDRVRRRKKLTSLEKQKIRNDRQKGLSVKAIARKYSCSETTVVKYANQVY